MIKTGQLTELKQHLRKLLQEELCLARFSETDQGDFLFHYEGMRVRMCFDPEEVAYLWMGRAFHWAQKPQAEELALVDRCINEVNHRYKVVKLSRSLKPDREGDYAVTASVSIMVESIAATTAGAIERYLNLIKAGCKLFGELHRKETRDDAPGLTAAQAPSVPVVRH
jgi:hypothetical protein